MYKYFLVRYDDGEISFISRIEKSEDFDKHLITIIQYVVVYKHKNTDHDSIQRVSIRTNKKRIYEYKELIRRVFKRTGG